MKRTRLMRAAWIATLSAMTVGRAEAAQTLRAQVDQNGDFILVGNTLGYECAAGTPLPIVGTADCGGTTNNGDHAPDIFWRADSPGVGQAQANASITVAQARSTAVLSIPPGATVTHAFLYWSANAPGGDNTVTLDREGGFSQTVVAMQMYTNTLNAYQGVADITSILQANGSGPYRVSDVNAANIVDVNSSSNFAGWWMVVFYELPTDPLRNLTLFDGFDLVDAATPQNTTLSGFLVPSAFTGAKLGVVAFEGDNVATGDAISFGPTPVLSNALNPSNNFFNGTRSFLGVGDHRTGDLPELPGTPQSVVGIDIDVLDVTSKLMPGQTSVPVSATSAGDGYFLAGFVTSIPTFKPSFRTSEKTAVDLNGGAVLPGDIIEYTIVAANAGNDTAINVIMNDLLPTGVTYVPASMAITAGANSVPPGKTDVVGDDQCDYVMGTKTVTCRLGTGANGMQGGTMLVGESTTIKFHVMIDADASGIIYNQAVITASGLLGAPAENTPTDGNGAVGGQPPTPIVIDACETAAQCMAPTPHCLTTPDPNVCVECFMDEHCPTNLPTCDMWANTCTCVPSGPELCDGMDNDCNGVADDGFAIGMTCTVGVGECAAMGVITCQTPMLSGCDAQPLAPSTEVCDGLDNDCDGVSDDGNPGGGMSCMTGFDGICSDGLTSCTAGMTTCVANVMPGQQVETCDALDNDCNGVVDEGFNIGMSCTVGIGACANTGTFICSGPDSSMCDAQAHAPIPEVCGDVIDNNCDGMTDEGCLDSDNDGIPDHVEIQAGTDPFDVDSDDDGVLDGQETNWDQDSDGDGLINALDSDSDDDGLFDGTEMGLDCSNEDTDTSANQCIPDADQGNTTTDPLDPDTDKGGVPDGVEDRNHNGVIDTGETDANDPLDDQPCMTDTDCGDAMSGKVCDDTLDVCIDGCRRTNGNGCAADEVCSSADDTIGTCGPAGSSSSSSSSSSGGNGGSGGNDGNGGAAVGADIIVAGGGCDCNTGSRGNDTPIGIGFAIAVACAAMSRRQKRRFIAHEHFQSTRKP